MSESSGSRSASSSHGGGGGPYDGQGSPVPYRVGPLAYEPRENCKCNPPLKACRWISWSDGQPGHKYYRCRKSRTADDCGYFRWDEDDCSRWFKVLLKDLRDAVWQQKKLVGQKELDLNAKNMLLEAMQIEVEEKKKQVELKQLEVNGKQEEVNAMRLQLNAKQLEVQEKAERVEAREAMMKKKNQCIDYLAVFSVVMLIGMVLVLSFGK